MAYNALVQLVTPTVLTIYLVTNLVASYAASPTIGLVFIYYAVKYKVLLIPYKQARYVNKINKY